MIIKSFFWYLSWILLFIFIAEYIDVNIVKEIDVQSICVSNRCGNNLTLARLQIKDTYGSKSKTRKTGAT